MAIFLARWLVNLDEFQSFAKAVIGAGSETVCSFTRLECGEAGQEIQHTSTTAPSRYMTPPHSLTVGAPSLVNTQTTRSSPTAASHPTSHPLEIRALSATAQQAPWPKESCNRRSIRLDGTQEKPLEGQMGIDC